MEKITFKIALLFIIGVAKINARDVSYGIKGGLNFSSINVSGD